MKFMIVDDDDRIILLLTKLLSKYGQCSVASGAKEALEMFEKAHKEKAPFDAVFMDIVMPETDGHEVVKELRSLEKDFGIDELNTFKLIMISACSDTKNVCKSFFQGYADSYVAKPDLTTKLIEELKNIQLIA